jgi:hypothetical protein
LAQGITDIIFGYLESTHDGAVLNPVQQQLQINAHVLCVSPESLQASINLDQ